MLALAAGSPLAKEPLTVLWIGLDHLLEGKSGLCSAELDGEILEFFHAQGHQSLLLARLVLHLLDGSETVRKVG
jgi:hypothetical protein